MCMHRILLEDHAKPSIEGQRRLNPTLKEVVRKEVNPLSLKVQILMSYEKVDMGLPLKFYH